MAAAIASVNVGAWHSWCAAVVPLLSHPSCRKQFAGPALQDSFAARDSVRGWRHRPGFLRGFLQRCGLEPERRLPPWLPPAIPPAILDGVERAVPRQGQKGEDLETCLFTREWRVERFALKSKVCLPFRPTVKKIVLQSKTSSCTLWAETLMRLIGILIKTFVKTSISCSKTL